MRTYFLRSFFLFVSGYLLFWSCGPGNGIEDESGSDSRHIEKIGIKKFPLDSTTAGGGVNFQFVEGEDKDRFVYLNKRTNTLIFYDYETEEVDFQLTLEREGPNGVGRVTDFFIHTLDSIFVYATGGFLHLVDGLGKPMESYNLRAKSEMLVPVPFLMTGMPMMKMEDFVVINAWGARYEYRKNESYPESLLLYLNLKTKEITRHVAYPEIYTTGVWGIQLHVMFNTFNPNTSEIIMGFPIDDHIYVVGEDGGVRKHLQGSKHFTGVHPLSKADRIEPPTIQEEAIKEFGQTSFGMVTYDKYRNMYLRLVQKAVNEDILFSTDPKDIVPDAAVLFMDGDFNQLAEVDFDTMDYRVYAIFFTKEGIHIMRRELDGEDILSFDIFRLR